MPRNNVSEQIKWLLREKPFVPSAASLVAYDPTSSSSSTSDSYPDQGAVPNHVLDQAIAHPITQPTPPSSLSEPRHIVAEPRPTSRLAGDDMARLRATPGNGKPRLKMVDFPTYTEPDSSTRRGRGDDENSGRCYSIVTGLVVTGG
jgi:bloom syndrome protein